MPNSQELFLQDHTLFDKIQQGKNLQRISSRAMRVPLDIIPGGSPSQINPDGGPLGRGSAIYSDYGQITSVYFDTALEWTMLMDAATDSKEKAIESSVKKTLKGGITTMRTFIESLLNTDGSGTLDTVSSVSGSTITVATNANQFKGNWQVDVWSALGGTKRGTFTVFTVDGIANQITATGPLPATGGATQAGDLLLVHGAPGIANSSLAGIETYQVDSNTGMFLQLPRSSYPGMLKTPHVAAGNSPLTPQMIRLLQARMRMQAGIETPNVEGGIWHMNQDQESAWENVGLVVTQVIQNQLGGSASEDMLKRTAPKRMGDLPILCSLNAQPGRTDLLILNHWGRAETQKLGPYESGGQTVFPAYGSDGSVATSNLSYLVCGFNVYLDNPRAGGFIDGLLLPNGFNG
jgi:hypothetical protein